jgi:hypothetical protein
MKQKVLELAEKINALLEGENSDVVDAALTIAFQLRWLKQFGPKEPASEVSVPVEELTPSE